MDLYQWSQLSASDVPAPNLLNQWSETLSSVLIDFTNSVFYKSVFFVGIKSLLTNCILLCLEIYGYGFISDIVQVNIHRI